MLIRRTPLKRSGPPRKKRPGTRRGQATPKEVEAVRDAVYERAVGRCELNLHPECIKGVLPKDGVTPWDHAHAVHGKSKGAGGKWTMDNIRLGCWHCHLEWLHAGGKPCPPKVRP